VSQIGSRRSWILLLCALALSVFFSENEFVERWLPEHYIPLVAAWFAGTQGVRGAVIFLSLSALALTRLEFWSEGAATYLRFGMDSTTYLASGAACLAFLRPSGFASSPELTGARSHWVAWAALPTLILCVQFPTQDFDRSNVYVTTYFGAAVPAVVAAVAVKWRRVVSTWRQVGLPID
jgi:hypothetical protein